MRFDLTDLRLFLNVCQAGSITGGAERTHITLQSASERIRGMEDTLGVPLLHRTKSGTQPTDAGRSLEHHARTVLQQIDQMHGELQQYGDGLRGRIRLLCNTASLSEYLPDALAAYLPRHPRMSVSVEERSSEEIVHAIRAAPPRSASSPIRSGWRGWNRSRSARTGCWWSPRPGIRWRGAARCRSTRSSTRNSSA